MKILFVCMQYIHSSRWINQLKDSGHEIYVFDCLDKPIHEDLLWTNTITNWRERKLPYIKGEYYLRKKHPKTYQIIQPYLEVTASEKLIKLIDEIKPDLIHSMEMQSESYPVSKAFDSKAFNWAFSCWGNDIYFYKDLKDHKRKISKALNQISYNFLECERDKKLIQSINSFSQVLGTKFPGGGGYKLEKYKPYRVNVLERKLILIKGYEHKFGRALNVLSAVELITDQLKEYDIYVYSAHDKVIDKILDIKEKHGLKIEYSSRYNQITHEELLEKFGKAKIAIGNNISDGIANTLLEAIILGAFPIQSNPGGASEEFVKHEENGFLINDPENILEISRLISKSLKSESLIELAYKKNIALAEELEYEKIKANVISAYEKIESEL